MYHKALTFGSSVSFSICPAGSGSFWNRCRYCLQRRRGCGPDRICPSDWPALSSVQVRCNCLNADLGMYLESKRRITRLWHMSLLLGLPRAITFWSVLRDAYSFCTLHLIEFVRLLHCPILLSLMLCVCLHCVCGHR